MTTNIIEFWKTGENPITCYVSKPMKDIVEIPFHKQPSFKKKLHNLQPVIIEDDKGEKVEIESVVATAPILKISKAKLYDILNGRGKNDTGYKVYKSQINQ